jgi:hypothetical protein
LERKDPSGPLPIASAIRQFLKESGLRRPSADQRVFEAWSRAAGETWRPHARPCDFRAGQLVVEVASSVHLAELKGYHSEGIKKRANQALGETRIHKVVFKLKS